MKAQVIVCKCGQPIAGCVEPYCYTEKDWMKDVRNYAKKGYTIEMRENVQVQSCTCDNTKQKNIVLHEEQNPNQMSLNI